MTLADKRKVIEVRAPFSFGDARLPVRIWDKIVPEPMSGCWLWTGAVSNGGYAMSTATDGTRRRVYAHRLLHDTLVAQPLPGMQVDHVCRVRCCVNPDHLEAVTPSENIRRSGVSAANKARWAKITHCPQGHEYTPENSRIVQDGDRWYRKCETCRLSRAIGYDRARRERARLARGAAGRTTCCSICGESGHTSLRHRNESSPTLRREWFGVR